MPAIRCCRKHRPRCRSLFFLSFSSFLESYGATGISILRQFDVPDKYGAYGTERENNIDGTCPGKSGKIHGSRKSGSEERKREEKSRSKTSCAHIYFTPGCEMSRRSVNLENHVQDFFRLFHLSSYRQFLRPERTSSPIK